MNPLYNTLETAFMCFGTFIAGVFVGMVLLSAILNKDK
jgi:hypothetical protein